MTMITPSYLGETIEYSSLHACRSTLEDPTTCRKPIPMRSLPRVALLIAFATMCLGQSPFSEPLKFEQVEQLVKVGTPDITIAEELRSRGISFSPSESNLEELKRLGAGPRTLDALRSHVDLGRRATPSGIRSLKPQGFVSDYAGVLDTGGHRQLEDHCKSLARETGAQLAVVTLSSLEGSPIEQVTLDLFRSWGIGRKEFNDGLLLLLAIDDRRSRLEVGRGLTQVVTDAQAANVLASMRPELREKRYAEALLRATAALNLLLHSRQLPAGAVVSEGTSDRIP